MTILLFKKMEKEASLSPQQKEFLAGAISALSYLEALAFKEDMKVLRAGLRFAQIAVESEVEFDEGICFQDRLHMILDKTLSNVT